MAGKPRGRPLKFGRPARLLALTLPDDVVRALRRIHPDPAWAIVSLYEQVAQTPPHPPPAARPVVDLAQLSAATALIVVDPRAIRSVPGMSVVPVAAGRAFLAFDEGRGLADLELAIFERLQEATINDAMRRELKALHRQVRDWRRERGYRFSKRSVILVERVRSSRRRRAPARSAAIPGAGSAATGR
jgi:hypothetical protein